MIVNVLFDHKKSISKRIVCIIFIKNLTFKKTQKKPQKKKTFLVGYFRWVFLGFFGWVFLGGFFIANPAFRSSHSLRSRVISVSRSFSFLLYLRSPEYWRTVDNGDIVNNPRNMLLINPRTGWVRKSGNCAMRKKSSSYIVYRIGLTSKKCEKTHKFGKFVILCCEKISRQNMQCKHEKNRKSGKSRK